MGERRIACVTPPREPAWCHAESVDPPDTRMNVWTEDEYGLRIEVDGRSWSIPQHVVLGRAPEQFGKPHWGFAFTAVREIIGALDEPEKGQALAVWTGEETSPAISRFYQDLIALHEDMRLGKTGPTSDMLRIETVSLALGRLVHGRHGVGATCNEDA